MIEHLLTPLVCERFRNDARYREGHLRVINALPARRVLGLHTPQMKQIARQLSREGYPALSNDGADTACSNGAGIISRFEAAPNESLCYEETVIWGFLVNQEKCPLEKRLAMLKNYIPVLDNWAVCDTFCANAKWMARTDKSMLWNFIQPYFRSTQEFEVRFAIVVSMTYLLNEEWLPMVFEEIDKIELDSIVSRYRSVKGKPVTAQQGTVQGNAPYYVRMGVAWLLATALAKFPEQTRVYARSSRLPADVIRLYARKARESLRTRNVDAL